MNALIDAIRWFNVDRAAVLVAVAALVGIIFAARSARSAREQAAAAREQATAAREQVKVSREQTALLLRQVEQSELVEFQRRTAERDALLPAVVVSIQQGRTDPSVLVLVVENLGKTAARNVRITPSTELIRSDGKKMHEWRIFTDPVLVMPPGHRMQHLFGIGGVIFNGKFPTVFSFRVEADGPFGALPTETYDVDLDALRDVWIGETSFHTLVQEIKRTNRGLDELKDAVRKLDPEYKAWLRRGLEEPPSETPEAGYP
ncbi:hypothetical protein OHA21_00975 [Actinoplanes sp. NBC_00393]|uniref:hypothetical protein n=1 Tax=Actinoplanes sp. NBC_00393 TaxID=2975953 RepID=UPI002E1BDD2E